MADKQDKKTKITPESAGHTDNGKLTKRDEANSMDQPNGNAAAATPAAKKKHEEDRRSAGGINGMVNFIKEVRTEAKKITWPPRSQVMSETWSVIVMVAFITVMVLGFDYVLGNWIFGPIEHAGKMMAPKATDSLFEEVPVAPTGSDGSPLAPGTPAPGDTPSTPSPDATLPVPAPVIPGTTAPVTPAPGAPTTEPGSALPPAGNMPGLPAPTSTTAPSTIPGATTAPVSTTTPSAPQTPAPGAAPTSTTPPAPATTTTPHP
ncbi:MAG: preprotein translocase subunit SecE [Candidatus Melainabacteria bacterium]|nr:preprotein translocase subunit SecE [Candidatus Melainabacteria bacterium]